ncbi:unnamed protein product [Albugo candida]|uniref:Uncharacterized protein n=1 Tax=Albugo candida TaxID=65357 RepID=A0A024GAN4_9STRA|nr:unnamed protein product [Albugo candida]|eukprot:CCI43739.1 unnamed protein product [Albugo candida]
MGDVRRVSDAVLRTSRREETSPFTPFTSRSLRLIASCSSTPSFSNELFVARSLVLVDGISTMSRGEVFAIRDSNASTLFELTCSEYFIENPSTSRTLFEATAESSSRFEDENSCAFIVQKADKMIYERVEERCPVNISCSKIQIKCVAVNTRKPVIRRDYLEVGKNELH